MTGEGPYPYASPAMIDTLKRRGIEKVTISAECGDGWLLLIDTLIGALQELGWDGHIDQIKEKFGGLRFYISSANLRFDFISSDGYLSMGGDCGNDNIFKAIELAEAESFRVCENCGSVKDVVCKTTPTGWLKTYCGECWPKVKYWKPE